MTAPSGSVPETYDCFCGHPADEHALGGEQECASCDCTDYEMEPVVADVSGSVPEPVERRGPVLRQPRPRGRANDATRELLPEPAERDWSDTTDTDSRYEQRGRSCTFCLALAAGPHVWPTDHAPDCPRFTPPTPPVPAPTEPKENTVSERGCEGCGLTGPPWEVTGVRQDSPEDAPITIDSWACDDDLADVVRLIQDRIGYSTVVVIEHV